MATDTAEKNDSQNVNGNTENGAVNVEDSDISELEQKIVRQVEYYFGDINLPKDKFMLEKIKLDDGWITMSVMTTFQRLAQLSTDHKVIAKALFHSDLIEVDDSGEEIKIRRSPEFPLPEFDDTRRKELMERSIYCSGFPQDAVMDELINFFNPYGPVDNIVMRKYKDKLLKTRKFKGSVFVTFKTKEKGQEFLDIESVKYQDVELVRKWQSEYIAGKRKEIMENKLLRSKKGEEKDEEAEAQMKQSMPRGATINLKGDFNGVSRDDIKEKFTSLGYEPAFVDFRKGETDAYVRLGEENSGKNFMEKVGSEIEISNSKLTARLLEGEEENTFLSTAAMVRSRALKKRQQLKKGGRKGKGGKANKGGRKRKGSPVPEESPEAKKAA